MRPMRLVEPWERAAAGLEDEECLAPSRGILVGFSVSVPVDMLLLIWVWPWLF